MKILNIFGSRNRESSAAASAATAAATPAKSPVSRRLVATLATMGLLGLLTLVSFLLLATSPLFAAGHCRRQPVSGNPFAVPHSRPAKWNIPRNTNTTGQPKRPEVPGLLVMDVDAGADDAIALLLTLRHETLVPDAGSKLIAVTCTHGNTALENVQRNVLKTLHLAGRLDIPVYSGAYGSLLSTPPSDNYFGSDGFGDFEYFDAPEPSEYLQKEHAALALVHLARKYPGQITILATGPLTNLAMAIRLDPEFRNNIKQLVVMGGTADGSGNMSPGAEFNFFIDPEAVFIVFNSTTNESKPIYLVPWDTVARRNYISLDWRMNELGKLGSKYMDFLNKAESKQLQADELTESWFSADPITAAILIQPDLVESSEQHHAVAETQGMFSRGAIHVDYTDMFPIKNTVVITDFDVDMYKNLLLEYLS